jgi:hypothetical protein
VNAPIRIECQVTSETIDLNVARGGITAQRGGEFVCIEPESE